MQSVTQVALIGSGAAFQASEVLKLNSFLTSSSSGRRLADDIRMIQVPAENRRPVSRLRHIQEHDQIPLYTTVSTSR